MPRTNASASTRRAYGIPAGYGAAMADTALKPAITRTMLLFFIVGDILGGGIYALVGEVGDKVGGAFWTAFLAAGVVAAFTAASYAELVSKYPLAGGAALFVHRAFKRPAAHLPGRLRRGVLGRRLGRDAGDRVRRRLPERVRRPADRAGRPGGHRRAVADQLPRDQGVGLLQPRLHGDRARGTAPRRDIGAAFLLDGGGDPGRVLEFKEGDAPLLLAISGASLAFYALIGFEDSVNVAEETRGAERTFPGTLFLGLAIAGAAYLVVTIVTSMAVATDTLAASDGPLLEVVQLGPLAVETKVFSAIALFALVNGALINMVMASRLVYGMAEQRVVPRWFGKVHPQRRTPWAGILLAGSLAGVLVVIGDLETLADTTVLLLLFAFVAVHLSVLVLRRTPVDHEHFTAWIGFPVLGALSCGALIVQKLLEDAIVFAYAGRAAAVGLVLWLLSSRASRRP